MAQRARVRILESVDRFNMGLGDDKGVRRRLWVDIFKGEADVILIEDSCRDFFLNNPAKDAIRHSDTPSKRMLRLARAIERTLSQTAEEFDLC